MRTKAAARYRALALTTRLALRAKNEMLAISDDADHSASDSNAENRSIDFGMAVTQDCVTDQEVPILAEPNFGLISAPRWPQALHTNLPSRSDSRASAQPSALVSMWWLQR